MGGSHFQGTVLLALDYSVLSSYWQHTTSFYFPACRPHWGYQPPLPATEVRCQLLVGNQRKTEVARFLGSLYDCFPNLCWSSAPSVTWWEERQGGSFLTSIICKKVNVYIKFVTERKRKKDFKRTLHVSTYETILLFSRSRS